MSMADFFDVVQKGGTMLKVLLSLDDEQRTPAPKEGELYKVIKLFGRIFEIRYGYYEECDRHSRYAEPVEIYPDFLYEPQYTDEGIPFVTAIQAPCQNFCGERDENSTCEDCRFYRHGEELLGVCACPANCTLADQGTGEGTVSEMRNNM